MDIPYIVEIKNGVELVLCGVCNREKVPRNSVYCVNCLKRIFGL